MTTIAYTKGIMACDSCWTLGDVQVTSLSKIARLSSGSLLGQAGDNDAREMEYFLDKVKTVRSLPTRKALFELRLDYSGMFVLPTGQIFRVTCREDPLDYKDEVGFTPISRKFAACGSGNEFAHGAMMAGASAHEAVQIAAAFDINTRGPFHKVALK